MSRVLVVDDEVNVLASFERMLVKKGHEVCTAGRAEVALAQVETAPPDLVIMDIHLPGMNGLEAFRRLKERQPKLPVIIMTGYGTTEFAIEATKLGAFDYRLKPFEPDEMLRLIGRALESVRLMQREVALDPGTLPSDSDALVGTSPGMQEVYKTIGRVAQTDATVLIRGETGTGKELVARALYQHSWRNQAPLVTVNCVAIPETLLESELFGHEKGAFTGATTRRIGKFEQADSGTLFLDEIGELSPRTQAKILRALQERSFERVGGSETIRVDVRVIAATNRNLEKAIAEGAFRSDLYHRLDVVTIHLPPLRQRRDDIPRLTTYFLERFARQLKIERPPLSTDALEVLSSYSWPGNVRELEHCIERTVIFTRGHAVQADDVRRALERQTEPGQPLGPEIDTLREVVQRYLQGRSGVGVHELFMDTVDELLVAEALRLTDGNKTHAARRLGLSRPTFQAKIQKHGVSRDPGERED